MRTTARTLVLVLSCLVAVAAAAYGIRQATRLSRGTRAPDAPPPRPSPLAGVVIFCIDTLRHDATVPNESGVSKMPSLDAFARGATRFDNALAPSSWTGPSVASLLTGYFPTRHGLVNADGGQSRMPASVATLASTLRDAGWSTWASMGGGWASAAVGMGTGFAHFDEDFEARKPGEIVAQWRAWRPKERPFFLVLHTYAAHDPWGDKSVPREARCAADAAAELAAGKAQAARMKAVTREQVDEIRHQFVLTWLVGPCSRLGITDAIGPSTGSKLWDGCLSWLDRGWRDDPFGKDIPAKLRAGYVAGLPFADRVARETLAAVDETIANDSDAKKVLVIVASDHGETFGDHGAIYHSRNVYEDLIRVPLLVRGPGFPAGARVAGACGLIDVAPTVLAVADVPGRPDLDGTSLLPLVSGEEKDRAIESFVRPSQMGTEGHLRRLSVRSRVAAWSAEFDTDAKAWTRIEWYDRLADPEERTPLPSLPATLADAQFKAAVEKAKARVER